MLECSFGLTFLLKSPQKKTTTRYVYLRITVDRVSKETSTKRKWDVNRWDQKTEWAVLPTLYILRVLHSAIDENCKT